MKKSHSSEHSAYELMLVLLPNLGEDATEKEIDEIRKLITSSEGEIYNEDLWGNQELAYTIRKQETGYYAVLNFRTAPANLKEIERALTINNVVLRFLITKTPASYHIVTHKEYREAAEQAAKEKAAAKKEKEEKTKPERKPAPARIERKAPVKKVEAVEEAAPAKAVKAAKKPNTEEAENRLKSIIDDPDITL